MLLVAALLGYYELMSTFQVLTWRIMLDPGEAENGGSDDAYYEVSTAVSLCMELPLCSSTP